MPITIGALLTAAIKARVDDLAIQDYTKAIDLNPEHAECLL